MDVHNFLSPWIFVGFSNSVRHNNMFKILAADTGKILYRSHVHLPKDIPNMHALEALDIMKIVIISSKDKPSMAASTTSSSHAHYY